MGVKKIGEIYSPSSCWHSLITPLRRIFLISTDKNISLGENFDGVTERLLSTSSLKSKSSPETVDKFSESEVIFSHSES